MLPRADNTGIRPVASSEAIHPAATIADPRKEMAERFSQFPTGKMFKAEVLSHLTEGSFMVQVADTPIRMNLPAGTQVGESLNLKLLTSQPQPSFALETPASDSTSADTSLSNTGKLIDTVLRAAQKDGAQTKLVGKSALVASPGAPATQVATALKDSVTFSGLFYESHVQQWATGARSLSDLMREPQAQNSNMQLINAALRSAENPAAPTDIATSAASLTASEPNIAPFTNLDSAGNDVTENSHANTAQTGQPPSTGTTQPSHHAASATAAYLAAQLPDTQSAKSSSNAAEMGDKTSAPSGDNAIVSNTALDTQAGARAEMISRDSAQIIAMQLETLEHQRVAWQGELWPGQKMEWEITEESGNSGGGTNDEDRSWQSVIRFEMPNLGTVSATVRLTGQHVQVQVRAANNATATLLRTHGTELANAMEAAGSSLDLLTVKHDESA